MSALQKKALAGTVVCIVLVSMIASFLLAWPAWAWIVVMAALFCTTASVFWYAHQHSAAVPTGPAQAMPQFEERKISNITLPSKVPDYNFLMSATVRWRAEGRPDPPHANPAGLAADAILQRARSITIAEEPEHVSLVQHKLNAALGLVVPNSSRRIVAMAVGVALTLSDSDATRLRELADVRKNKEVWEHERKYEESKRAYLNDDVLKDAGSAITWWLANHDSDVEQAVNLIGPLAKLSAAAHNTAVPDLFLQLIQWPDASGVADSSRNGKAAAGDAAEHLRTFMRAIGLDPNSPEGVLYAHRIAGFTAGAGQYGAANDIDRRFEEPQPPLTQPQGAAPEATTAPSASGAGGSPAGPGERAEPSPNGKTGPIRPTEAAGQADDDS